jgi:hypothetical protein
MFRDAQTTLLARNYERWADADRRATRWFAAAVGAAGLLILGQLEISNLVITEAGRFVLAIALLLIAAILVGIGAFMAERDADKDLGYALENEARQVAERIDRRHLSSAWLPYQSFEGMFRATSVEDLTSLEGIFPSHRATVDVMSASLDSVLQVQQHLWSLLSRVEAGRPQLKSMIERFDSALYELQARLNFERTRSRMNRSQLLIAAGAVFGATSIVCLVGATVRSV